MNKIETHIGSLELTVTALLVALPDDVYAEFSTALAALTKELRPKDSTDDQLPRPLIDHIDSRYNLVLQLRGAAVRARTPPQTPAG